MLHQLPELLTTYGYGALFVATVVEGPIVTVIAGFLASQGLLDGLLVFAVAVVGDLTGDLMLYAAGRWGRMTRWARLPVRLDSRRIAQWRKHFRAHPGRVLLFGKLTHGAGFLFLLAAGAAQIRLGIFTFYNFLGTLPKSAFFVVRGYLVGAAYVHIDSYVGAASVAVFVLICVAGLALTRDWRAPSQSEA
jgi:membrane protein DedA with SNARE-associated domain